MAALQAIKPMEARTEPRDEVHYRARGIDGSGLAMSMVIVNISPGGLMARCEDERQIGEAIRINLPLVGNVRATVRWSLGGRLGCQFDQPLAHADYYQILATIR